MEKENEEDVVIPVKKPLLGSDNSQENQTLESETSVYGYGELSLSSCGGKRRSRRKRTISMDVLQQYFAGSLKDAAKSLGVCPTTLKRICRQNGIDRWPFRKIKKVGHSMQKLQLMIDSVEGFKGSIKPSLFYQNFSTNPGPKFSERDDDGHGKSRLSSGSQTSSGSSTCCSAGTSQNNDSNMGMKVDDFGSDPETHFMSQDELNQFLERPNQQVLETPAQLQEPEVGGQESPRGEAMKIKTTYGESKIWLSLQCSWRFMDLQREIAQSFSLDDISQFDLKYLDDDEEWVLLTCDADLEECRDIYKQSKNRTVKISVHRRLPKLAAPVHQDKIKTTISRYICS